MKRWELGKPLGEFAEMQAKDPRGIISAYRVICSFHGRVCLTRDEYDRQMNSPNDLWMCPVMIRGTAPFDATTPGTEPCLGDAQWDDDWYEMMTAEPDE